MTDIPDFRGRIESDKPQDFLHRIANMVPGYTGYQDRERRREADKELRMYLARRFRDQHAALIRVQQQLARTGHLTAIAEVDRLAGVLQRFIDKLEVASQGYAGLFDPVKVDMPELDQLYTFDAALTGGLQQVTDAVQAVTAAGQQGSGPAPADTAASAPSLDSTLAQLGSTLDALLTTWNQRSEVILSGHALPADDFNKFRTSTGAALTAPLAGAAPPPAAAPSAPSDQPPAPYPAPSAGQPYQPYAGPGAPAAPPDSETRPLNPPPAAGEVSGSGTSGTGQ